MAAIPGENVQSSLIRLISGRKLIFRTNCRYFTIAVLLACTIEVTALTDRSLHRELLQKLTCDGSWDNFITTYTQFSRAMLRNFIAILIASRLTVRIALPEILFFFDSQHSLQLAMHSRPACGDQSMQCQFHFKFIYYSVLSNAECHWHDATK